MHRCLFITVVLLCIPVMGYAQTYNNACTSSSNSVVPSDYGDFVQNTPNDSLQRVENAATLNAAIANAPSPGTVCLPEGEYYLFPTSYGPNAQNANNIEVYRDSITIWGAGNNQNGNGTGLHTRGSYHVNNDGDVVRGNGLHIDGSDSEVFQDYTLRDFEIDGESGYTGDQGWPADPSDGSGFDLTHKGIKINSGSGGTTGTAMKDILIENIWLHGYQGEITHSPGFSGSHLTNLTLRNSIVADANGGSLNFQGDRFLIKNNIFQNTKGWGEFFSWGWSVKLIGNTFKDQHEPNTGYALHGHDTTKKDSATIKNNTFKNCDTSGGKGRSIAFTGGFTGPGVVENNTLIDCQLAVFQHIGNPDDPTGKGQTPWNENVTIKHNTVQSDFINLSVFIQSNYTKNVSITDNVFKPRENNKAGGNGVINYCCGPVLEDVVVSDNTFKNLSAAEAYDGGGGGDIPFFNGTNTYINVGWNFDQQDVGGTYNIMGARLEPRVTGSATGEMYLPTSDRFSDGHTVTLKKRKPYGTPQFSTTNNSVDVKADEELAQIGDSLTYRYDAYTDTTGVWKPVEKRKLSQFAPIGGTGTVSGDTITGEGSFSGSQDHGHIHSVGVDTTRVWPDTMGVEAHLSVPDGPQPFSMSKLRLATSDAMTSDRAAVECSRVGYCRLSVRKNGTLTKYNWQQIPKDTYMRIRTDGQYVWAEHDADQDRAMEVLEINNNGTTSKTDDRVALDLGSTPHAGVGCVSGQTGVEATCRARNTTVASY